MELLTRPDYKQRVVARVRCTLRDAGRLAEVQVREGGAGFRAPPTVSFPGLEEMVQDAKERGLELAPDFKLPTAKAVMSNGTVMAVKLTSPGKGIVAPPEGDPQRAALMAVELRPSAGEAEDGEVSVRPSRAPARPSASAAGRAGGGAARR